MKPIKDVQLSFRCQKEPDKMLSCRDGKFCTDCNKTVVDFRNSNREHLLDALEKNETVCGIFFKKQMAAEPSSQSSFFNRFVASLLITLGIGSFGKGVKAQPVTDSSGFDSIPADFTPETIEIFMGTIASPMPSYKFGGETGMAEFLKKNLRYPADSAAGRVLVSFVVDTNGKVTQACITRSVSPEADKEALRVIQLLEFSPAKTNGKKIQAKMVIPIVFKRED